MTTSGRCLSLVATCALRVCGAILALLLASPWLASPPSAQEAPRRVLMLHAFNYTFPATTQIGEAARKRLLERSPQKIEIDADFLDLARVTDPGHEQRTADFLREKYARTPPDVVMTLGSAALPFIVKHRDAIAPKVRSCSQGSRRNTMRLPAAARRDRDHQRVQSGQDACTGGAASARCAPTLRDCGKRGDRSPVAGRRTRDH